MTGKIVAMTLLSCALVACGSSDGDSVGQYGELEQFKGEHQEPALSVIVERDEDSVEINSHVYGEFEGDHTVLFQYTALQNGEVAVILNSTAEKVIFSISNENVNQGLIIDSGNITMVFPAKLGELYEIRMRSEANFFVPYQFKIVRANRSSLELSDSEYWVYSNITDRTICADRESTIAYSNGRIFNFEQGYVSYGVGDKIVDWNVKDAQNFNYTENYSDEVITYSYEYDVELNVEAGNVVGTGTFTSSYLEEGCTGLSSYEGKIIL